jgi:hypothetical protein
MSVGGDGTIYLAGDTGVLYAYARSGELQWSRHPVNR